MTPPAGFFVWTRKRKDFIEIAAHVDLHLAVHRRQHDFFDQHPDDIGGLCALLFGLILLRIVKLLDTPLS